MNAIWSAASAVATPEGGRVVRPGPAGNVSARTDVVVVGRQRARRWPAMSYAARAESERSGLRGLVGVEVGKRVGTAGPEEVLGRGASGGDLVWLGGEVEVGEDGGDDGRVGDGGEDPHRAGAARAHPQVVAEHAAVELGPG